MSCANVVISAGRETSVREEPAVPSSRIPLGPVFLPFPRCVPTTLQARQREPSYGSASLNNPSPSPFPLSSQGSHRLIIFASPSRPFGAEGIRECPGLARRRLSCKRVWGQRGCSSLRSGTRAQVTESPRDGERGGGGECPEGPPDP